ncbi:hypothetical protein LAZ40_06980 [Cereibacter sphaeroides]|uniref:hypothetical protein n=1 Tax=Cereibacter sphaeroides TaxID=1063 RepID=UPI001F2E1813|nr:hypothetical protein [Cereibacter sphaeroides]MCE6958791.1 hypothetical protein [Cereibacter sphaeroides]MCE6973335.1 hypothetical protein [Cereibacter sphaeroides]
MQNLIIGLSGRRKVGKTKFARHLVERHGFRRLHPFDGGKAAARGYYVHLGADEETAYRMTDGDLKDVPSPILPVIADPAHGKPGDHYSSRFFMEKFAQFMGVQMGPEWTVEMEIARHLRTGEPVRLIAESMVYEAEPFRRMGGIIIELVRPDYQSPDGLEHDTDRYSRTIVPDFILTNDGSEEHLFRRIDDLLLVNFGVQEAAVEEPML